MTTSGPAISVSGSTITANEAGTTDVIVTLDSGETFTKTVTAENWVDFSDIPVHAYLADGVIIFEFSNGSENIGNFPLDATISSNLEISNIYSSVPGDMSVNVLTSDTNEYSVRITPGKGGTITGTADVVVELANGSTYNHTISWDFNS